MNAGMFMLLFAQPVVGQECEELKRDMKALEIFLQDQDDVIDFANRKDDFFEKDIELLSDLNGIHKKILETMIKNDKRYSNFQ